MATSIDEAVLVCEVSTSVPSRIVICPLGTHVIHGNKVIVDEPAARDIISVAAARGVDLVIDYDHQSEGGKHARADGRSPAAAWIKRLAVEPRGLVADVEWTADARALVASKQYRYLSPVILYDKTNSRAVAIRSVALTNTPAIDRFPAMVASRRGGTQMKESTMDKLKELLGLPADATDAQVGEAVASLKASAGQADGIATAVAKACGVEKIDTAEAASKAVETAVARASTRGAGDGSETITALTAKITELATEVASLRGGRQQDDFERAIAKLDPKGNRVTPADHAWLRPIFDRKPEDLAVVVASLREKVNTGGETGNAGGGDRAAVIAKASSEWNASRELQAICSKKGAVNDALQAAGMPPVEADEATKYAIAL